METIRAIEQRRSVREYRFDSISEEMIGMVLDAGSLAPSAKNRQPWRFVVVRGLMKDKIVELMKKFVAENDDDARMQKIGYPSSVGYTADVVGQAPVLILVFRENDRNWVNGDYLSIGACMENMCLRATDLGLGSLWIRDVIRVADEIIRMFEYDGRELVSGLVLGYASRDGRPRKKKGLEEIVEWM